MRKQDFVASGFKPLVGRVLLWWSDGEQGQEEAAAEEKCCQTSDVSESGTWGNSSTGFIFCPSFKTHICPDWAGC